MGARSWVPTAIQRRGLSSLQHENVQRLSLAAPFWVKTLEETHAGPGLASSRVPGKLPTEQNQPVKTG